MYCEFVMGDTSGTRTVDLWIYYYGLILGKRPDNSI